jgi:hypothetical protein
MLKSLTLSLLALAAFSADKPAFTDPALATYTKSIEDIDQKALISKREARNKAVVALDAAIKRAMAASDLDKAVFLKGEKERIAKEWVPSDAELIGDKPVDEKQKKLTGVVWLMHETEEWKFTDDGNFTAENSWIGGKWEYVENSKERIKIMWKNGNNEILMMRNGILHHGSTAFTIQKKKK